MELLDRCLSCRLDAWVGSQPKVVIAGEVDEIPALVLDVARIHPLQRLEKPSSMGTMQIFQFAKYEITYGHAGIL